MRIRFELPRAEVERARRQAREHAAGFDALAKATRFESRFLLGRVHLDLGAPFLPDPLLDFLRAKRGLAADPPLTVSLDQPLAHFLGQLASSSVMALHGEGAFSVPLLKDGRAVGVGREGDSLALSVPLEQYAGTALIPAGVGAAAVGSAASSLASLVKCEIPQLSSWSYLSFLEREARILQAVGEKLQTHGDSWPTRFPFDRLARKEGMPLLELLAGAEERGAHVVPYWRIERDVKEGVVRFEPLRRGGRGAPRGAIARLIVPGGDFTLNAASEASDEDAVRVRERLKRPVPFFARFDPGSGRLVKIEEQPGTLPIV